MTDRMRFRGVGPAVLCLLSGAAVAQVHTGVEQAEGQRAAARNPATAAAQPRDVRLWIGPPGGAFQNPANWSPAGVPTQNDDAVFASAPAGPVLFSANATVNTVRVENALTQLSLGNRQLRARATAAPGLTIGGAGGAQAGTSGATLRLLQATNARLDARSAVIGPGPGLPGFLDVGQGNIVRVGALTLGSQADASVELRTGGILQTGRDPFVSNSSARTGLLGPGAQAEVIVSPGATWSHAANLFVGGSAAAAGFPATIHVGGFASITGRLRVWPQGEIDAASVFIGPPPIVIRPGLLTANRADLVSPARFTPTASFEQSSGGTLTVFGFSGAGEIVQTSNAVLRGGLVIEAAPGFLPSAGSTFPVVDASTRTGRWDVVQLPGFPDDRFYVLVENGADLDLEVRRLTQPPPDFNPPNNTPIPSTPANGAEVDFDGDGDIDIVLSIPGATANDPGIVSILLNAGTDPNGTWLGFSGAIQVNVGRGPAGIAAGDLNGDEAPDIIVTETTENQARVIYNDGMGGVGLIDTIPTGPGSGPVDVVVDDFDGTFPLDAAIACRDNDTVFFAFGGFAGPRGSSTVPLPPGSRPGGIDRDDADGDKELNAFTINEGGTVGIVRPFGAAAAGAPPQVVIIPAGDDPTSLVVDDLDGDGLPEISVTNRAGVATIIKNLGGLLFAQGVEVIVGDEPVSITSADLDNDGDLDLALVATGANGDRVIQVLRNDTQQGQIVLARQDDIDIGEDPIFVLTADMDGDGSPDLVTGNAAAVPRQGAGVSVLLNAFPDPIPGDIDGDFDVDADDLQIMRDQYGGPPGNPSADINGDGLVNFPDLNILLANFGFTANPTPRDIELLLWAYRTLRTDGGGITPLE